MERHCWTLGYVDTWTSWRSECDVGRRSLADSGLQPQGLGASYGSRQLCQSPGHFQVRSSPSSRTRSSMSSGLMTWLSMFSSFVSKCRRGLKARECHQSVPGVRGKNSFRRQVPCQWRSSTASFQANYVQCPSDRRFIELVSEWPNCTLSVPPPWTTSTGTLVKYDFQNAYSLTRSVRIPLLAQGWLTTTSPRPFEQPDTKVEAFIAVTAVFESFPGFQEYFHDHRHMPFGNELLLRLDSERVKRLSGSTRRRQPRHVLSDPLLWHGLEVAMPRRNPSKASRVQLWRSTRGVP